MTPEDEEHFRQFEEQGESTVRLNIAAKRYGESDSLKHRKAEEWIRRKDEARQNEIYQTSADINRRITEATELSATSAKKSAFYAKVSSFISGLALFVSIVAFFSS
jgi:hypothetical protein